ncbi:hypothetical protein RvY_06943 [Ramazzottius varieornatus]|uniref:Uncharacterized protein n=1 Tax=Ramazzottius varieornatus TaxID=947166 RepID=A0A1D1V0N9_RAMVA|nr:hypothetical protein RvY_06943 [Ramazzottius varieornatus]
MEEGLERAVRAKTSKIRLVNANLNLLFAHQALFLLKNCLCLPKLLYILRCSPVWKVPALLREFDEVVRSSLSEIANTGMSSGPWRQATLPVGLGGLGIRRTEEVALPAFLASLHSVRQLVLSILPEADLHGEANLALSKWSLLSTAEPPVPELRRQQKAWDMALLKEIHEQLVSTASDNDKARLLAVSDKNSGSWLHALPLPSLGNLLDNNALRISIGLRLGAKLCRPHVCRCGASVDEFGQHGLSCKFSGGRHSALNESLKRALTTAQIPTVLEPPGIFRKDKRRPDGMTQVPWKNGKELVWDVTVVDTQALTNFAMSTAKAGSAADAAEKRKITK